MKITYALWFALFLATNLFYDCSGEKKSEEQHTVQVSDSGESLPHTVAIPADSVKKDTGTVITAIPDTTRKPNVLWQKTFSGEIEGFKSQAFDFDLKTPSSVSIQVLNRRQAVFKLYRTTSNLSETILKEDYHSWNGELEEGEYQLKVFLPLKLAARKKKSRFQIQVKGLE